MDLQQILDLVTEASAGDGNVLDMGDRPRTMIHKPEAIDIDDFEAYISERSAHGMLAVHRERPEISMTWGLTMHEGMRPDLVSGLGDGLASLMLVDILLHGAIIHRAHLWAADSWRCFLPYPTSISDTMPDGVRLAVGSTYTRWVVELSRLLNDLNGRPFEVDKYLRSLGIDISAGHPLDPT